MSWRRLSLHYVFGGLDQGALIDLLASVFVLISCRARLQLVSSRLGCNHVARSEFVHKIFHLSDLVVCVSNLIGGFTSERQ